MQVDQTGDDHLFGAAVSGRGDHPRNRLDASDRLPLRCRLLRTVRRPSSPLDRFLLMLLLHLLLLLSSCPCLCTAELL